LGFLGFEAELAERQLSAALGIAMDAALVRLAEFGLFRLQHLSDAFSVRAGAVGVTATATTRTAFAVTIFALATRSTLPCTLAAFRGTTLMRRRIVLEHFAFEDPDLDADDAVGRLGFGNAVVDVGAQRVQRHTAFAVPFGTGDVGTAEAATDV